MTIYRKTVFPPEHVYPIDDWRMVEQGFHPKYLAQNETLFAIGNGYLGMRGNFDEGAPTFQNGTFINGFHETWPIVHGEDAYGFAKTGQTMLNATNTKTLKLYVDDEPFYLPTAHLTDYERALDMRAGTLDRTLIWDTDSGKHVRIRTERLVSFKHRHLAAICYEITVLNATAPVVVISEIQSDPVNQRSNGDPRRARGFHGRVLLGEEHSVQDRRIILTHKTRSSQMTIAAGIDHTVKTRCSWSFTSDATEDLGEVVFSFEAQPGEPIRIEKLMAYHTSTRVPTSELRGRTERALDRAVRRGYDSLLESQRAYLDDFWRRADIEIENAGYRRAQQCLRWNLFQLLQATARAEGTGVGARGLTGQTYEGHYFWDTEIYVLPFLTYTEPRIAKNLLTFRYRMLDLARERARAVSEKGALFPWRTINGEEASAYYAAGTAQYHINADIMYALKKYVLATGDETFLYEYGAEMLVETARLWFSLGFFSEHNAGQFCIHGVTGPDEYNTTVDNNTYTNLMARENLRFAAETLRKMRAGHRRHYAAVEERTLLDPEEIDDWEAAAEKMYIPYDEALGIHPQDDDFLHKEPWDFENTPPERYPLLLHYHPLVIYRHKVIKQADIVLAMFLLSNEFSKEQKRSNFDYYDPLTTGDSSLSACIQSIIADEIGYEDRATEYLMHALLMDLADVGGNVKDGAHIASIGGVWLAIVYGAAGLRDNGGRLNFSPRRHTAPSTLRFGLHYHGQLLRVEITGRTATYRLEEGSSLTITHHGNPVTLEPGKPQTFKL